MKIKIDCSAEEMTNGFLDHLTFGIDCDITIIDYDVKIPFDPERLKICIEESEASDQIKQELLKDDKLQILVFDVIWKTINKLNVNHSEVQEIEIPWWKLKEFGGKI